MRIFKKNSVKDMQKSALLNLMCSILLRLPKRKEEYTSKTLFAFFDGLIPEGWLLNIVTHNWKLNPSDRFGILLVACRDSIGNVSIREVKE